MKKIVIVLMFVIMCLINMPVDADSSVAPVEIHFRNGDSLVIWECWPGYDDSAVIVTYLNMPEGIATYSCFVSQTLKIEPIITNTQHTNA